MRRVALFVACLLVACRDRELVRPNVLLITLDTFRADRLGSLTPNLMRLANESVRFDDATAAAPLTFPSHATILSGHLPLHLGIRNNGAGVFPQTRDTLATVFSQSGYRTAAFVSAFVLDHRFGLNRGFDVYDDAIARDPNSNSSYDAERRGGETVDHALAWLAQDNTRPYFAWVHLYDAHAPYAPPAPFPQTYDGEIAYVDAQVGRLLASIDRTRTIIAVVGDHGESLGEHNELTHGLLLYQSTLHVPMFVAVPGVKAAVLHTPVMTANLAITLTSFALKRAIGGDGLSLSEEIRNHREPPQRFVYAESQYATMFGWSDLTALRFGAKKLIQSSTPELYDLAHDPHEAHNTVGDDRRTFASLAHTLGGIERTTVASTATTVDAETRAKLASLGYVSPSSTTSANGPRPSPAVMAPLFRTFEEANAAANANRPDEAIAKLQSIVAQDPQNPIFRGSLAHALRVAGRVGEAIPLSREAVAMNPNDAEAWYNLAVTLQEAGKVDESVAVIQEAIRRDPKRPEAHNELGIALVAQGKLGEAQREFATAISIDPRDARAYANLANVLRSAGRLDEAAAQYDEALRIAPNYADALNGRGVIEVQRDRPQAAVPYFDRALQISPRLYEAQLNRGIALQLAGDRGAARQQFQSLLSELPRAPQFNAQRRAASALLLQLQRAGG